MKLLVLLLCLAFVATSLGRPKRVPKNIFVRARQQERIINGSEVAAHSIPYQAYLEFEGFFQAWACGGSLISESFVLTAGHCTYEGLVSYIVLGAHDLSKKEDTQQQFQSTELYLHEKFDYDTVQNDIGLVKLPQPAQLNQYVQLAVLPSRNEAELVGLQATVSGWGLIDYFKYEVPDVLYATVVQIVPNNQCAIYDVYVPEMTICTKGETSQGSCEGDSGGPLTADGKLVGIVSYGPEYCQDDLYPNGFTRVTNYLPWIANITGLNV
ncbi:chymotrypsin-like [Cylas formicarius]|uniref:chymotrypsin-like n=1 Tax=Cylas formicarius TaxID=197179 RepID=UPI002958D2CF|nr:chymotrypsin-like [Cylas formicarius]